MKSSKITVAASLVMSLFALQPNSAFADDEKGWNIGLGLGYEIEKSLFKFDDEDGGLVPLPILEYNGGWYSISPFGVEAEASIYEKGDWEVEIFSELEFGLLNDSRDESDSRIFAGMDERKEASHFILGVDLTTPVGIFGVEAAQDVSSAHDGYMADIYYRLPLYHSKKTNFIVSAGVEQFSGKFIDYYYGVRANEVNADRSFYKGESASSAYVGYLYEHELSKHWSVLHELKYSDVPDEVRLSPLTENEDSLLSTSLLLVYRY